MIVIVSQQSFSYMGFSGAVIIFETNIKIFLMPHIPFVKDIAHAIKDENNLTEHYLWMTADVQYLRWRSTL